MPWKDEDEEESIAGRNEARSGVAFWTPPGVKNKWTTSRVRIMPPHEMNKDGKFYYWVATHGNLPGADRPILCVNKMFDRPCPACDAGNQLWRAGKKEDARKFFSSYRGMMNVVVLDMETGEPEDGAQIEVWGAPRSLLEDLIEQVEQLPKGSRAISSPSKGRDVFVRRKGTSATDTNYEVKLAGEASEVSEEIMEMLEGDNLYFLPDIYPEPETEHVAGLLVEAPAQKRLTTADPFAEDEDEEEEEKPIEGNFREVSSNPFPDEDDDEDEEEEDDDEVPPSRGSDKASEARRRLQERLG